MKLTVTTVRWPPRIMIRVTVTSPTLARIIHEGVLKVGCGSSKILTGQEYGIDERTHTR